MNVNKEQLEFETSKYGLQVARMYAMKIDSTVLPTTREKLDIWFNRIIASIEKLKNKIDALKMCNMIWITFIQIKRFHGHSSLTILLLNSYFTKLDQF